MRVEERLIEFQRDRERQGGCTKGNGRTVREEREGFLAFSAEEGECLWWEKCCVRKEERTREAKGEERGVALQHIRA